MAQGHGLNLADITTLPSRWEPLGARGILLRGLLGEFRVQQTLAALLGIHGVIRLR